MLQYPPINCRQYKYNCRQYRGNGQNRLALNMKMIPYSSEKWLSSSSWQIISTKSPHVATCLLPIHSLAPPRNVRFNYLSVYATKDTIGKYIVKIMELNSAHGQGFMRLSSSDTDQKCSQSFKLTVCSSGGKVYFLLKLPALLYLYILLNLF